MRFKRTIAAVAATVATAALVATMFVAGPASAASRTPSSPFEQRVQRGATMALADNAGHLSRATIERSVRKALATSDAVSAGRHMAGVTRDGGKRLLSNFWGANYYCPAISYTNGGGTVVSCDEYVVEEFPEGCRMGVTFLNTLNGNSWPLDSRLSLPALHNTSHSELRSWLANYQGYGSSPYVASASGDGLYAGPNQSLHGHPVSISVKGASESTWHYHYGNSGNATVDC